MSWFGKYLKSSVGAKHVMAITGLLLVGFVIIHMIGNLQIFIGQESGYQILEQCSIVAAPYTTEDNTMGVLGVIGPTRMAYERVIPIVDVTSKLLGRALKSGG